MNRERRRIAVTGYGMITPLGKNAEDTFSNCLEGKSGIDYVRSFNTEGLPCRIAGEVDDEWIKSGERLQTGGLHKFSSRSVRLMTAAVSDAVRMSGLNALPDRNTIGVSLGSHGDNPSVDHMKFLHRFFREDTGWDMEALMKSGGYPYLAFFRRKPDAATSILSRIFGCAGPSISIVSACAAGSQAIGEAAKLIQDGKAIAMIAGGCEATIDFTGMIGFIHLKALCEKYPEPQKASRPFDRRRSGFVMSEGAGAVILENMDHARQRGAGILGELKGYGSSADAYRITDTHPRGLGAVLAMKAAVDDACVGIEDIDYINAHGTSTQQNDLTETRAIKEVFGDSAKSPPASSNKSMLGHTIAAAGAIECILTLMGINRSVILPTINYESRDPKCNLDYVPNEARQLKHQTALSNSFGFGGQNACLCISAFNG